MFPLVTSSSIPIIMSFKLGIDIELVHSCLVLFVLFCYVENLLSHVTLLSLCVPLPLPIMGSNDINIISANVRGLRQQFKRIDLFEYFKILKRT